MNRREEDQARKGFEVWAVAGSRFFPVIKAANGDYFNTLTNEAWKAWKAALDWAK